MPLYLRWLTARVEALGGSITRMNLSGLPTGEVLVVNASGIGARLLGGDESVVPVRGQVVLVEQVGVDRWWIDAETPSYVVPRSRDIVLGGTAITGEWSRTPEPATAASILGARRRSSRGWPARGSCATRSACGRVVLRCAWSARATSSTATATAAAA